MAQQRIRITITAKITWREYTYANKIYNDNTFLLSHAIQNNFLQEQYASPKNIAFLQVTKNVFDLLGHHTYHSKTKCTNKKENTQLHTPFNVNDSLIKKSENNKSLVYAYKIDNNVKK